MASWSQASATFVLGEKERKGENPAIGEDAIWPTRRVITFKCSGKLRNKVNGKK